MAQARDAAAERSVRILAGSLFALGLGEELWQAYLPAYLASIGATSVGIGIFASLRDLLDGLYQRPGGWLADRFGRRRTLMAMTALAAVGYATYAAAPAWPFALAGLMAAMAWKAGAFPTTFAVIGDALPPEHRARAFAIQSVLVRVPRIISAPLGGLVIAALGVSAGVRVSCLLTVVLAMMIVWAQYRGFHDARSAPSTGGRAPLSAALRHLLTADSLVRVGEGVAASFIVLYVIEIRQFTAAEYGLLYALQQAVAVAAYVPGAWLAKRIGQRLSIALSFACFAAFPLAVRFAVGTAGMAAAFSLGGLREIGEPARKALIVDLAPDGRVASTVGSYYLVRNLLVFPAGLAGGLLWRQAAPLSLEVSAAVAGLGLVAFLCRGASAGGRRHAAQPQSRR